MANPVDKIPVLTSSVLEPKKKDDSRDAMSQVDTYNALYLHDALVVDLSTDHADEVIVDIYDRGFTKADGTNETPTRVGRTAHCLHSQDWWFKEHCQKGQRVLVQILTDGTCWIAHERSEQLGIIVCYDCDGNPESKLPKNYYYVQFARIWNKDGNLPHKYGTYPAGSNLYNIVPAENLFERNCKTHHVRPGTVVVVKWNLDNQTPIPARRYFFEVADEGTCAADPCPPPSYSSSSSSGCPTVCWFRWDVVWDCNTLAFLPPHASDVNCSPPHINPFTADPIGTWIYDGPNALGNACLFHYIQETNHCCVSPGQCVNPVYPGNPVGYEWCCSRSSHSSHSMDCSYHCYYTWTIVYDCHTKSFSSPIVQGKCYPDSDPDPFNGDAINTWVSKGRDSQGNCEHVYHARSTQCCTADYDCMSPGAYPGNPTSPDACCPAPTPCNPISHISFSCSGSTNIAIITYCDGKIEAKSWGCCCGGSSSGSTSGSTSGSGSDPCPKPTDAPTGLTAIWETGVGMHLSWTGVGGTVLGYGWRRYLSSDCSGGIDGSEGVPGTSCLDTTARDGQVYSYRVRAFNSCGDGPESTCVSVTT